MIVSYEIKLIEPEFLKGQQDLHNIKDLAASWVQIIPSQKTVFELDFDLIHIKKIAISITNVSKVTVVLSKKTSNNTNKIKLMIFCNKVDTSLKFKINACTCQLHFTL